MPRGPLTLQHQGSGLGNADMALKFKHNKAKVKDNGRELGCLPLVYRSP